MEEQKWNDNDRDFLRRTVNYKKSQGQKRIHWKNIGARFTLLDQVMHASVCTIE